MSGLRIVHINPRLIGSVENWSGKDKPEGSWLIKHAKEMDFNTIWFSPLHTTTNIEIAKDGRKVTGSLYAASDHFALDDEFSAAPGQSDKSAQDMAHLKSFTAEAKKQGLMVMGDLIFNHVAADHPLVLQENNDVAAIKKDGEKLRKIYRDGSLVGVSYRPAQAAGALPGAERDGHPGRYNYYFKFSRNDDLNLQAAGNETESWDDVARINYASPEAMDFFVHGKDGKNGYWKQLIDWHLERGFTGFRCDAAYLVPPQVWSELVQYTHDRQKNVVFMAETLGGLSHNEKLKDAKIIIDGKERPAFDLSMLSTYWWDFKEPWLIWESKALRAISTFGGAGFPDNHDTPDTVAGHFRRQLAHLPEDKKREVVADICVRNYAVAALIANSVYMQLGYEYCRDQISVFRGAATYEDWKKLEAERSDKNHPYNLIERIRAINDFKKKLQIKNAVVKLENAGRVTNVANLIRVDCALQDQKTGMETGKLVLYINEKPENGPITIQKQDVWDKEQNSAMKRLHLEDKDESENFYKINDIAAYHTKLGGGLAPTTGPNARQRPPQP